MNHWKVFVAVAVVLAGCMGERGSGVQKDETREVPAFTEIELDGAYALKLTVDKSATTPVTLHLSGDDNLLPLVLTEVEGDKLHVHSDKMLAPDVPLVLTATVADLKALSINGACEGTINGLDNESLTAEVNGAGELTISGRTGTFTADLNGAAELKAKELQAESVTATINGAGDATICASKSLKVEVNGAGDVKYYCNPADVKQEVNGAGDVQKM
jgi:hypothetical protein